MHRDVKPGNVLLTQSGTVKVTDFGIARAGTSDGLTQTGSVMGTATYFSPEQAQGLAVDGRSDVYSVGVVLYEMVCGVAPFIGDSPVRVAYKHVREEPVAAVASATPTSRPPRADHHDARSRRIPSTATRAPTTCAPTSCASGAAGRSRRAGDRARRSTSRRPAPPCGRTTAAGRVRGAATVVTPRVDERGRIAGNRPVPRKTTNTALVWTLTLLGLAAVVGAILFAAIKLGGNQVTVTVPNEVSKTVTVAQQDLENDAPRGPTSRHVADANHAVDTVVRQEPAGGKQRVDADRRSTLFVSSGGVTSDDPLRHHDRKDGRGRGRRAPESSVSS